MNHILKFYTFIAFFRRFIPHPRVKSPSQACKQRSVRPVPVRVIGRSRPITAFEVALATCLETVPACLPQTQSTRVLTDIGTGLRTLRIDGMSLTGSGFYWWKYGDVGENGYQ